MDNLHEFVSAAVIVVVLVGLAIYFAWRQWKTLRDLRRQDDLPTEDRRYHQAQAWRRLLGSVLMVVLAALLVGSYLSGQERQAANTDQNGPVVGEEAGGPAPNPDRQRFLTQYSAFWLVFTLILLCWLGLALFDVWAIRRFALRHFRRIQIEKRDMIDKQVGRMRSQRNGHG